MGAAAVIPLAAIAVAALAMVIVAQQPTTTAPTQAPDIDGALEDIREFGDNVVNGAKARFHECVQKVKFGVGIVALGIMAAMSSSDTEEQEGTEAQSETDSQSEAEPQEKPRETKKERRKRIKEERKKRKEQEPASEDYVKHKARELEKKYGKDARRRAHDKKRKGESDRSKQRIDEDYK